MCPTVVQTTGEADLPLQPRRSDRCQIIRDLGVRDRHTHSEVPR